MGPVRTRRFIRGASRGCKVRAEPGLIIDPAAGAETRQLEEAQAEATRQRFGVTRRSARGSTQESATAGQPAGEALGSRKRNEEPGQPGSSNRMRDRRREEPGRLGESPPAHRRVEAPGKPSGNASRAAGFGKRGNPGNESSAIPKGSGGGATRSQVSRHRRKMKMRGNPDFYHGEAGDAGGGATQDLRQKRSGSRKTG